MCFIGTILYLDGFRRFSLFLNLRRGIQEEAYKDLVFLKIYQYLVSYRIMGAILYTKTHYDDAPNTPLVLTWKKVHEEAEPLVYKRNTFVMLMSSLTVKFLTTSVAIEFASRPSHSDLDLQGQHFALVGCGSILTWFTGISIRHGGHHYRNSL